MKYHLILTAALAAASLAACQPAPAPEASEPEVTTAGVEAPVNTQAVAAASQPTTDVVQPVSGTATVASAIPPNCPAVAWRNWQVRLRAERETTWIDLTGEVDIPNAYYTPIHTLAFLEAGRTEVRFDLRFIQTPPGPVSQAIITVPVQGSEQYRDTYTRVDVSCGGGVIATFPLTRSAQ